jgi:predicted DNA repair protein MutK
MASGLLALFDDVAAFAKIASASLDDVVKMSAKAAGKSILPLLILGGAYLCYEGYGKMRELFVADSSEKTAKPLQAIESEALEREKIASAIRTDFILSAEIMAITLSTVGEASLAMKAIVLAVVVAEYGLSGPEYWIKDVGASAGSMMPIGGRMVAWVVGAALAGMAGLAIGAAVAPLSKHVIRPLWQRLLKLRCFDFYRTRTQ